MDGLVVEGLPIGAELEEWIMKKTLVVVWVVVLLLGVAKLQAGLIGSLFTPDSSGVVAGDDGWAANLDGFGVKWTVSQNQDLTWHYKYEFFDKNGALQDKKTSHFIISLSEGVVHDDIIIGENSDIEDWSIDTYGEHESNPGFPTGESIYGVKFGMTNNQDIVEFDVNRQPMWGDFYAKDGKSDGLWNFAYNTDLGVTVANPYDYMGTPVDAFNNELHKILVPDTIIPEPATISLLCLGSLTLLRKQKK